MLKHWFYCSHCGYVAFKCPVCGNNCCNGGHGTIDGKPCPACELAYAYQELAVKTDNVPSIEEVGGKTEYKPLEERLKESFDEIEGGA